MLVWIHDLDRYEHPYHQRPGKTEKASRKLSNLFEDIKKVEEFAISVDSQSSTISQ